MAYIKVSRSASGAQTVQLATKYHGKTQILKHFGSAHTESELIQLKALANKALHSPEQQVDLFAQRFELKRVRVTGHAPIYFQELIAYYYRLLGFEDLGPILLFDLVLLRLYFPCSKLRSLRLLKTQFGKSYGIDAVYRLLPKLADEQRGSKDRLLKKLYDAQSRYYTSQLTVILYDVTTLYFEAARDEDEYKLPGYSKDGKNKDPQILVGLLANTEGFPMGYETFPGNTFEGQTLLVALQSWQKQFTTSKLRVVADAGMLSKLNTALLNKHDFDFIVGARLKSVPANLTKQLIAIKKEDMAIETLVHDGNRLIVQYSAKRAKKDLHTLDKAVVKAQAIVDGKQSLKRRSKFLVIDEPSKTAKSLNQAAIDQDKALAGLKGYITNLTTNEASDEEVIAQYRELWHIEQSFRMSKHDLRARPIFHYKEDSIKAHLQIVIMALAIARLLEKDSGQSLQKTVEQLTQALSYELFDTETNEKLIQHPEIEKLDIPTELASLLRQALTH